jgi:hypothetical protein
MYHNLSNLEAKLMYLINLTCQIECSNVSRCNTPSPTEKQQLRNI